MNAAGKHSVREFQYHLWIEKSGHMFEKTRILFNSFSWNDKITGNFFFSESGVISTINKELYAQMYKVQRRREEWALLVVLIILQLHVEKIKQSRMRTLCLACSHISVIDLWTAAVGSSTEMKCSLSHWMHTYKCTFGAIEGTAVRTALPSLMHLSECSLSTLRICVLKMTQVWRAIQRCHSYSLQPKLCKLFFFCTF